MKIQVAESGYKKLGSVKTRVVESETSKRSFSPELLRRVIPVLAIILFTFLVSSCDRGESAGEKPVVVVTILPQVEFVKEVGGDRVVVTVMVPPGANAHIYEPTPSQMTTLAEASMYAKVGSGIEFELTWMEKLRAANEEMLVVDCSTGVPLQEVTDEGDSSEIDPHIWMSPGNVAIMVQNIYDGLVTIDAANKPYYARNRDTYIEELTRLDQEIRDSLSRLDSIVVKYEVIPDEMNIIASKLAEWADGGDVDIILTTGGTGLGPRDVTPEATLSVVNKVVPGFAEAMRAETFNATPMAILSRAVAGVRGKCLIVNLPGSPQAVKECLEVVLPAIPHAVEIIKGEVTEHKAPGTGKS